VLPPEVTNPLVTFITLFTQEQQKQADDKKKGNDSLVDDTQCRR